MLTEWIGGAALRTLIFWFFRAGVTCMKADTEVKEYRDIQESCCQCCKDGHRAGIFQRSCTLPFAENEYCSVSFKTCCEQGEYLLFFIDKKCILLELTKISWFCFLVTLHLH